jgi:hypothetical protein
MLYIPPGGTVIEPEDPVDSADATAADSCAALCGVIWTKCHRYTLYTPLPRSAITYVAL